MFKKIKKIKKKNKNKKKQGGDQEEVKDEEILNQIEISENDLIENGLPFEVPPVETNSPIEKEEIPDDNIKPSVEIKITLCESNEDDLDSIIDDVFENPKHEALNSPNSLLFSFNRELDDLIEKNRLSLEYNENFNEENDRNRLSSIHQRSDSTGSYQDVVIRKNKKKNKLIDRNTILSLFRRSKLSYNDDVDNEDEKYLKKDLLDLPEKGKFQFNTLKKLKKVKKTQTKG